MRKFLLRLVYISSSLLALGLILYFSANAWIDKVTSNRLFTDLKATPHRHVGLLLGTAKLGPTGWGNPFYNNRIDAADILMKNHVIDYLIISGDNHVKGYDEPSDMRQSLMERGIDSTRLILDYAGFRTFDSIIRAREIFDQDSILIISQQFHNERALFIASRNNIDAIGFNAADVDTRWMFKTALRERFARIKMLLDDFFGAKPHFLGPKVAIPKH